MPHSHRGVNTQQLLHRYEQPCTMTMGVHRCEHQLYDTSTWWPPHGREHWMPSGGTLPGALRSFRPRCPVRSRVEASELEYNLLFN